jgi:hypothetical protein
LTSSRTYVIYGTDEDDVTEWLSLLVPLFLAARARALTSISSVTETDGSIVLIVVAPAQQVSKRLRFPLDLNFERFRQRVLEKFERTAGANGNLSELSPMQFDFWVPRLSQWLSAVAATAPLMTLKSQDLVEIRLRTEQAEGTLLVATG